MLIREERADRDMVMVVTWTMAVRVSMNSVVHLTLESIQCSNVLISWLIDVVIEESNVVALGQGM